MQTASPPASCSGRAPTYAPVRLRGSRPSQRCVLVEACTYEASQRLRGDMRRVFSYVHDFANLSDWDPGGTLSFFLITSSLLAPHAVLELLSFSPLPCTLLPTPHTPSTIHAPPPPPPNTMHALHHACFCTLLPMHPRTPFLIHSVRVWGSSVVQIWQTRTLTAGSSDSKVQHVTGGGYA